MWKKVRLEEGEEDEGVDPVVGVEDLQAVGGGYGVSASSYKSKPKTSLRSYNPYSYSGGRSSSYNGFGLGLGAGMIVGYQLGGLHRPIGYSESSYNYNYIHKDRGYYQETPLSCVKAEAYEYLKLQSDLQEVDIEEGDEICESPTDVCFGRIHITKAEITTANSTEVIIDMRLPSTNPSIFGLTLQVKIEKGCIGNDTLEKQDESTYDTDRKCFTSSLNESSNTNGNRNGIPSRLIEALGIENDLFMNVTLQSQMETCTCKGWRPAPSSRNGLYNRRNTGYGTYRTRRTPLPRTSLYSRQYGNFYGRRSSSYNGFGLGMGAGLLIGYRFGVLSRPIGYGGFGYNYRYIHEHRSYNMDRPYTCTATNVSEFIKTMDSAQELNIDEGEIMCSLEEDVCFGKITVLEANITMADGSGTREGFEIKIEKGCGRRSEFSASNNTAKYDSSRQCWTSRVDNRTLASLGDNSTAEKAENVIPEKLIEVLGLKGKSMREASVS
ncbi:hypothetical protein TCAL_06946, partial [Tigriopus californicus]|eukprot:TCALIF_06946-PA protein Name:"Protein of unknown function" AED:0.42 eAED:0.64 QI:0/0.16/0.14/0.42/1/0.85/7/0/494